MRHTFFLVSGTLYRSHIMLCIAESGIAAASKDSRAQSRLSFRERKDMVWIIRSRETPQLGSHRLGA